MQEIFNLIFRADSIWSIVARGVLWLLVSLLIIISTDQADPEKSIKNLKSNLGFFLFFIFLSGTLIYLLFGYQAV